MHRLRLRRRWLARALARARPPLLSFLWPGLGQLSLGQRRLGAVMALPPLAALTGLVLIAAGGAERLVVQLLSPGAAAVVVLIVGLNAGWWVASIIDAWRRTPSGRPAAAFRVLPVVAALSIVVVATHAFAAQTVQSVGHAAQQIFIASPELELEPQPRVRGGMDTEPDDPSEDADRSGVGASLPRNMPLTVLIVGIDSAANRAHALTDTIIVADYDPLSERVVMISIPRDTGRLPLSDGSVYPLKINGLMTRAERRPDRFPLGGIGTLRREVEHIIGVPIPYYATVDMRGFRELIDAVGGIEMTFDRPLHNYHGEVVVEEGRHHLDGRQALAVARSRFGPGNNDYARAERHQQLLRAIAARLREPAALLRMPEIAREMADVLRTNAPIAALPDLMALLQESRAADKVHVVLGPNRYASRVPPGEVNGVYMTELDMDAVADLSVRLFGPRSRYSPVGGGESGPLH